MKLVKSTINQSTQSGTATLLPQEPEDMWHLYNLIRPGDVLRATARRKVIQESRSAASSVDVRGSTTTKTVHTTLSILVTRLDFDPQAAELHVAGRICEPNPHTEMWAHHTLDLDLQRQLSLTKGANLSVPEADRRRRGGRNSGEEDDDPPPTMDAWDSVALDMLKEATDARRAAHSYAVVMDEGLANIAMLTEYQTVLRQRVEVPIARKRTGHGAEAHEKALDKFYEVVLAAVRRHVGLDNASNAEEKTPPLVLASPGFTAKAFLKYMIATAQHAGDKSLTAYARNNVIVAHSSTGHLHSLHEALCAPEVQAALSDTRYARETVLMERFMKLLRDDAGWAWYGPGEVERAVDKGAVGRGGGVLLISNKLFRSYDIGVRKRWVKLVERVREVEGGEVRVLSSAHESGKKLEGLGDVGAILTFPLLDLDEDEEDEALENDSAAVSVRENGLTQSAEGTEV